MAVSSVLSLAFALIASLGIVAKGVFVTGIGTVALVNIFAGSVNTSCGVTTSTVTSISSSDVVLAHFRDSVTVISSVFTLVNIFASVSVSLVKFVTAAGESNPVVRKVRLDIVTLGVGIAVRIAVCALVDGLADGLVQSGIGLFPPLVAKALIIAIDIITASSVSVLSSAGISSISALVNIGAKSVRVEFEA